MKKLVFWLACLFVATISVAQLEITTQLLPDGDVGQPYNVSLSASGGTPPYTWSWSRTGNDLPFDVTSQPNSFSPIGVAQGWQADWGDWSVPFEFGFPFGDSVFTSCHVYPDGNIYLGNWDVNIGVFNADIDTSAGDIFIESNSSSITIRWDGRMTWNISERVSFSLTLNSSGLMIMKYGDGNASGGGISINGGDVYYSHPSSWNNMSYAPDIVYVPQAEGLLIGGLSISTNGVISGTPPNRFDGGAVIQVEDDFGASAYQGYGLVIHDDRDNDGMLDEWERLIVSDDPGDSINSVEDVLRDDNYDGDAFSNIEEFLLGYDPVVPGGDVPDTIAEGLELFGAVFTNDVDAAYFSLIDDCFSSVVAAEPANYSARVFRAASRLLNLSNDDDVYNLFEQFGLTFFGNFSVTGDLALATAPLFNEVSDTVIANILPALDASFADLEAIPVDWTGSVEISTNYFPVDETIFADIGDLTMAKAMLKIFRSALHVTHAQNVNLDYDRLFVPIDDVPSAPIIVDGDTNDWAGIPVQLVGEDGSGLIEHVKGSWDGSSVYLQLVLRNYGFSTMGLDGHIVIGQDSEISFEHYPHYGYTDIWFSSEGIGTTNITVYDNRIGDQSVYEIEIPVPPTVTVSNACVTDIFVEFGDYDEWGGYWYWSQSESLEAPLDTPMSISKQNHPEFLGAVRSALDLATAEADLQESIDFAQLADGLILARTDVLMHVIEYDPTDEAGRTEFFARLQEGEDSLAALVQVVVTNDFGEAVFDDAVHLGAFFESPYVGRAMLPNGWEITGQPSLENPPDPTLGGIFPEMSDARLAMLFWEGDEDTDADGDGMADLWELAIAAENPNDAIFGIEDVLRDGNYDGDEFTNMEEFLLGFDPLMADGNVPDTMEEGLALLGMATTNAPDAALFNLIDECFATVLAAEPTNHSARVFRAMSRLFNLSNDEDLYDLFNRFGQELIGNFSETGELSFASAPLLNEISDIAFANILPALDASLADLEAIPTNWMGAVEISTNYFPIDETTFADIGDLTVAKAALTGFRAVLLVAHAQSVDVDYNKLQVPMDAPQKFITVDGATNDWVGVPVNLIGTGDAYFKTVRGAWNGTNVYLMAEMVDGIEHHENPNFYFALKTAQGAQVEVDLDSYWGEDYIFYSDENGETETSGVDWIYTNGIVEMGIPLPLSAIVSNACITDAYYGGSVYAEDMYGSYLWQWLDGDIAAPDALPIEVLKQNHPDFLESIRSGSEMLEAKINMLSAIDLAQVADGMIQSRSDALMHAIEYDPANATDRVEMFARLQQAEESLAAPVQLVITNDFGESVFDETVHLGAFFESPYVTRAMAPEFWLTMNNPMFDTVPDPSFGGILPNMGGDRWLSLLWEAGFDLDWDGDVIPGDADNDGLPDEWEIQYFGSIDHPHANPDTDGDGDGAKTWQERIMGTHPTNANSVLKLSNPWKTPSGYTIDWEAITGRVYTVEWTDSLTNQFQALEADIAHPQNSYTDTVHTTESGGFYNLKVELGN